MDAKFKKERGAHLAWTELATVFANEASAAEAKGGDAGRIRYQKEISKFTGYTVGMLRGMAATKAWLDKLPLEDRPTEQLVSKSFTALDLIRRLDGIDPRQTGELLRKLGKGRLPVSAIRAELRAAAASREGAGVVADAPMADVDQDGESDASEPRPETEASDRMIAVSAAMDWTPSTLQTRQWRQEEALYAIQRELGRLSGEVAKFRKPEGVSPIGVRCAAIAFLDNAMTEGDGFEIVNAAHGLSRATLSDHVSRAIVASRFFRRFFLVFTPDSSPELVNKAVESLVSLEIPAVGVAWFGLQNPILLNAEGTPEPDRRHRLEDICRHGHWVK
jgi:hypothetical protein